MLDKIIGMDSNYGIASLPSGPPPPPPDSSPPSSHISDHIASGAGGNNSETNQLSSAPQQHNTKQQQIRIPLVNPVAPLNTREGHVTSHPSPSIPLPNVISGNSRYEKSLQ